MRYIVKNGVQGVLVIIFILALMILCGVMESAMAIKDMLPWLLGCGAVMMTSGAGILLIGE